MIVNNTLYCHDFDQVYEDGIKTIPFVKKHYEDINEARNRLGFYHTDIEEFLWNGSAFGYHPQWRATGVYYGKTKKYYLYDGNIILIL